MMKTLKRFTGMVLMVLMVLFAACSKDDAHQPKDPDLIQKPDQKPEPEPENRPPESFSLLTPEADAGDTSRTPTFSWEQATDPDGDSVTFNLYLAKESKPTTLIATDIGTTTFKLDENLDLDVQYHWKVVAKDANGGVTESAIGSFTTDLPIVFLTEYNSGLEGPGTLSFDYNQELLTDTAYTFGNRWQLGYDEASGKLSRTSKELNGELETYTYEYTSFGKQKSIKKERSAKNESWELDYDGKERLVSVVYEREEDDSDESKVTITLTYANENSSKPIGLNLVTTKTDSPETYNVTAVLEWDDENIISVEYEITENGEAYSETAKYTYDNNINPYYILTKKIFGFDTFFSYTIKTGMESIDFGAFYWQSQNNIVKMERVETSVKGGTYISNDTYQYTYSEDFYPLAATRVYTGGMSAEEVRELSWSY